MNARAAELTAMGVKGRSKGRGGGGEFIGYTSSARCSNLSRLFRENRIFMLTRTRPWDSPKFVRVAVGYLWTAVNKAPVEHSRATVGYACETFGR